MRWLKNEFINGVFQSQIHIKKKIINTQTSQFIYCFSCFEDYCSFIDFFNKNGFNPNHLANSILLYEYKNAYYLSINGINLDYPNLKKFFSCITEFASFINHSEFFASKLSESGKLIMKHNAISLGIKYFAI